MKKKYIAPDMEIVETECERLLAGSGTNEPDEITTTTIDEPFSSPSKHSSVWDN